MTVDSGQGILTIVAQGDGVAPRDRGRNLDDSRLLPPCRGTVAASPRHSSTIAALNHSSSGQSTEGAPPHGPTRSDGNPSRSLVVGNETWGSVFPGEAPRHESFNRRIGPYELGVNQYKLRRHSIRTNRQAIYLFI